MFESTFKMSSAKRLKSFELVNQYGKSVPRNVSNIFYTSSHGAPQHHLQESYQEILEDPRFSKTPIFNWRSGCIFTTSLVENIVEDVKSRKNQPQVVCLILGGNNLRDLSRVSPTQPQTPLEVCGLFREVLTQLSTIQKCWVVIVGLIPCENEECKPRFKETNQLLLNLSKEFKQTCSFVKTDMLLSHGQIRTELFKNNESPKVHLSEEGAKKLAAAIYSTLKHIPNKNLL